MSGLIFAVAAGADFDEGEGEQAEAEGGGKFVVSRAGDAYDALT
jgi:hypothetical protein